MSKGQTLRALVSERLAAAAEDIFVLFERTIAEYEEELCRSKEENQRKQQLLDLSPRIDLPTAEPRRAPAGCDSIKMSKGQTLRALVKERLTAAAEDIFVLFERTIAEYEEELCRSKEENQRKQQLQDNDPSPRIELVRRNFSIPSMSSGPCLNQEITESPQIKEEPEEQSIKQEDEQLPVSVPESSAVCVKTEESSLLQQRQTEHSSDTDNDDDWEPVSCSPAQMETEAAGDHVQIRDRSNKLLPKNRNHQCSFCNKRYITKQDLDVHIRTHTGERPFSCTVCKRAFTRKEVLKNHSRTHTGEKPYSCHICKKSFTQKGTLDAHNRRHTGEKPYSCTVCKKAYATKCALDYHRKTHSREKPYSCSICKKRFVVKGNLGRHRKTHLGEEPHSCLT